MITTREEKIKAGKVWQVYPNSDPDRILFEGSKTASRKYLRDNHRGDPIYRVGKLLWENLFEK